MSPEDEMRIRRAAAKAALFAYALTVISALAGLWFAAMGDLNSAVVLALSTLMFLTSAIICTFRTRGY